MTADGPKAINPIPNAVKKIMIIYHTQPQPEWSDVQSMINRLEVTTSNHADTNDYFGAPIMVVKGTVKGYDQKGESGKILEVEGDGSDADYLSWDSSPESVKNEKEDLKQNIYSMSQTPDISFEQMMEVGGDISGVALRMMFLDAHMAVRTKEEQFGIGLQRRLNLIKAAVGAVIDTSLASVTKTLHLKPVITPYLPQNITEAISNLTIAKTGGIISTETAVEQNPLIEDKEAEMDRMKNDKTEQIEGIDL
jgi:SPP1 family phage portal protein